jgi:hypothetical protein
MNNDNNDNDNDNDVTFADSDFLAQRDLAVNDFGGDFLLDAGRAIGVVGSDPAMTLAV